MTREEAICGLEDMLMSKLDGRNNLEVVGKEVPIMLVQDIEALTLAIEALQERPKGRWIELPCKVGDKVYSTEPIYYRYEEHKGIHSGVVSGYSSNNGYEWFVIVNFDEIDPRTGYFYNFSAFGKTMFLTKEEAEKALADMRESEQE